MLLLGNVSTARGLAMENEMTAVMYGELPGA